MSRRFILHMGMPKSASTTLQDTLPQARDITFLGKDGGGQFADPLVAEFTRALAVFGDVRLRDGRPHARAFESALEASPRGIVWLSDEVLSSAGFAAHGHSNSLPQILENFVRVVPATVEPVLIVRNQRALLKSYYKQAVLSWGASETFEEFVRLVLARRNRFLLPALNYVNLVRVLRGIVPKVHVICFEMMLRDAGYRSRMFGELGVGDVAGRLAETHSRPAESDETIRSILSERFPSHLATEDRWPAEALYPDLYAYRPIKTEEGKGVTQFLQRLRETLGAPGMADRRRAALAREDLFHLDERVAAGLDRHIINVNAAIETLDPAVDWRAFGY